MDKNLWNENRFVGLFKGKTDSNIETIKNYRLHFEEFYNRRKKELEKICESMSASESNSYPDDFLTDEFSTLDDITDLSGQLSIVALYRVVELITKKILWQFYDSQKVDRLAIKEIKELLLKDFNIKIEDIDSFSFIDELRCLNNAIKHQNIVTQKLAEYDGWVEGEEGI